MKRTCLFVIVGLAAFLPTSANAQHIDVVPHFLLDQGEYTLNVGKLDLTGSSETVENAMWFTGEFGVRPTDGRIVNGRHLQEEAD